jgi:hypothetical protein
LVLSTFSGQVQFVPFGDGVDSLSLVARILAGREAMAA